MTRTARPILFATAGLLALSACTDPSVDTGDSRQRTKEGVALGVGLGALTGLLVGDNADERRRGALIGAVGGAIAGGVIGDQLDKQAAELRQSLGNEVTVVNTGSELVVTMPQDILFATDSATVRPDLQADLRTLAGSLNTYPDTTVDVIGHTDNTGSASYNQDLSARRAASVSAVLTGSGVSPNRVRAYGRGEDAPVASNLTPEGRAQNRRVEIVIRPVA